MYDFKKLFNIQQNNDDIAYDKLDGITQFKNIMSFANYIFDSVDTKTASTNSSTHKLHQERHPILDLICILSRKIQTEYFIHLINHGEDSKLPNIEFKSLFFGLHAIVDFGKVSKDFIKEIEPSRKHMLLNRDAVLPWPWKRERLVKAIINIGVDRAWGQWMQDDNHYVVLLLPIGIGIVHGGNHSITSGIIQGVGKVVPKYTYDISQLYDYVVCDGKNYVSKPFNKIICPVGNVEFAAIYEIGRIMNKKGISF